MNILSLDLATTSGIAYDLVDQGGVNAYEFKGTPIELLEEVYGIINDHDIDFVVIEQLNYFRNAKTIRSLSYRIGFVYFSLVDMLGEDRVKLLNQKTVQKSHGVKNKEGMLALYKHIAGNSTNIADALGMHTYARERYDNAPAE